MPLTIPPFVQYQSPMFPLRGLWNRAPAEGDYLITCEIDWLVSPPGNAVQFSVSGNSPVALSQIVALAVDNSLSGSDVQFIFSDSGFKLTVPAYNQVVAPVFTNGLTFLANAPGAVLGDTTVFQILNSATMPVSIAPSRAQNHASVIGVSLVNGSTVIVPPGVNGTLNTISISTQIVEGATVGSALIELFDGTGRQLWAAVINVPANGVVDPTFPLSGLDIRFVNGIVCTVLSSTLTGTAAVNVYYSTP